MSLCLATAATAVSLAANAFTLSWTHSVERTEWREHWRVDRGALVLDEARVRGSGAGMEPPDGAVLREGWWVYRAARRLPALHLAASGATGSGWQLCPDGRGCLDLERWLARDGQPPAAIRLSAQQPCVALPSAAQQPSATSGRSGSGDRVAATAAGAGEVRTASLARLQVRSAA